MWPFPSSVGSTWVHRTIHAPFDPPALEFTAKFVKSLTFMVMTSSPVCWLSDAPVRSTLSPAGGRTALAGKPAAASRLCAICTPQSAFISSSGPKLLQVLSASLEHGPGSLASSVWYQATSTRPSSPATIHGMVLVPDVLTC